MTSLMRSILPIWSSEPEIDDEYNVEYSFAMEYTGPPVSYDIPRAAPVDVGHIPTASVVSTPSILNNLSLPIIHPVARREPKPVSSGITETHPGSDLTRLDTHSPVLPDGEGSSCSLGFSDSRGRSQELSISSDGEGLDNDCHEIVELGSSSEEHDIHGEVRGYDHRTHIVTFCEPESSATSEEESDLDEPQIVVQERQHTSSHVKKGLCHRCLTGSRLTKKETCIVCDAKFCSKCVLRVMGSMPEGRKCITCIGRTIDESKRGNLGKCSRVLKQLLTDWQVKQVMHLELSCPVNQPPYWLVIVNQKPLSVEEVVQLQSCSNPPKRLRPERYWYDKLSGFWGKEGHKPCQIISPELSVGGSIKENASNGNTGVKINNREITKAELLMLKLAKINYEGCSSLWVSHDGSYSEEGQGKVKGNVWETTGIKAICALLSLPTPSKSILSPAEKVDNNTSKGGQRTADSISLKKLLLVGQNQSGTSAIFKQAKNLYNVPFSEDERRNAKSLIQSNLYNYISILLEGRKQFEEEYSIQTRRKLIDQPGTSAAGSLLQKSETNIYSINPKVNAFSEMLLQNKMSGTLEAIYPAATLENSLLVEELWKDKAFQAIYDRRAELPTLPRVANYFLPRAVEISRADYEPSDMDILYADGISSSNGLASMEFAFPNSPLDSFMEPTEQNDPLQRYQLIRVHSSNLGENCKWLCMFEDVDLILYCVDLTAYDEFYEDDNLVVKNKMLESRNLFESMVSHPRFKGKEFLLMLNKFDLLEEKIESVPLSRCKWFHDFNPLISQHRNNGGAGGNNNTCVAQYGFQYVAAKFKRLFSDLTGRKLYVSSVTGLEGYTVDVALRYGKEVLKWVDEHKPTPSTNEWSSESAETTS